MTQDKGPCRNPGCDICNPLPRWKVSRMTVRRILHEREIKAATIEEALAIYANGTAWPASYDERTLEVLEQGEPVVELAPPASEAVREMRCYHNNLNADEPVGGDDNGEDLP